MKYFLLMLLFIPLTNVYASNSIQAKIGNQFFDTLEDAIQAASSSDIIILTSNVTLEETLEIKKNVNINLNNNNIKAEEQVFLIQGGSLNLSGKGKIIETKPNYGAIVLKGGDNSNDKDFSTVSVGSGITLEGWSGIFINHHNKTGYGILVNMNGSINAVNDVNGNTGVGIYVNGYIQNKDNAPIVNLNDTAYITSTGNGIYSAGYAKYYINGAHIEGIESGLGIKSGLFKILDGTIIGSGKDETPTEGNNNGINASGTAIQIESNPGYEGNIEINIKNGTFKSKNSYTVYEYTIDNSSTQVKNINIEGGTFISANNKNVFLLSESLINNQTEFISGGEFSSNPTKYLKNGYQASINSNNLYEVENNTTSTFGTNINNTSSATLIIIITLLIITVIIGYINRKKILEFINSIIKK